MNTSKKKLLIVTQTVDSRDPTLGFFHRWIDEFSKHCEQIEVICLKKGEHNLANNVHIYSLGKEKGTTSRIVYSLRFISLIWKLRKDYDSVFVHMNPEYVILGGLFWHLWHKPISLWYTHKSVNLKLRFATLFADIIFTASKESFRLKNKKVHVMGHGIDTDEFAPLGAPTFDGTVHLVTIGRRSPIKRIDILEKAVEYLNLRCVTADLKIVTNTAHNEIPSILAKTHFFLHASETGSLDKAPLEALASGVPVITSNTELAGTGNPAIMVALPIPSSFAGIIQKAVKERLYEIPYIRTDARSFVVSKHSLVALVPRILKELRNL